MENKILSNIKAKIKEHLSHTLNYDYSLLGGNFGQVLYLFLSCSDRQSEYDEVCAYLDRVLASVRQRSLLGSYCNGIAGLCVGLMALEKNGFIEDANESVSVFDKALTHILNSTIAYDLDFLHGAIGIGFYFVKRASVDDKAYGIIISMLDYLENHSLKNSENGVYWLYPNRNRVLEQNLSLSHGICSTAMFVARAYKIMRSGEDKERCVRLLQRIGQYVVSNLVDPKTIGCYTPMINIGTRSRLGWCYGDMGTSIALRAIGEITNDTPIQEMAYNIALYTARYRNNLKADGIFDACLCHGSSGVAHFFYNCLSYYGDAEFLKSYERWRKITLDMYDNVDGELMFGSFRYDTLRKHKCLDVLEGDAGVGLMLMGEHSLLDDILLYKY